MAEMIVQKFYPTPEELSTVCSKVKCPQKNCKALFQCSSNLNMHLIKHHKINQEGLTVRTTNAQYFCPTLGCPYHKDSKKHFKKLKYLKQHFLKVHALKEFVCQQCEKKFSTATFLSSHMKNCGKIFNCTCGSCYTSSEAILTHIKRKGKGHEILKNDKTINKMNNLDRSCESCVKKERLIYPKLTGDVSFPIHYIAAIALSELSIPQNVSKTVDKGIQTEIADSDLTKDLCHFGKNDKKRKNSQQTQTTSGKSRKQKISTQTQTNNDYLKRKSKGHSKNICKKRKKSMETQTKDQCKIEESNKKHFSSEKEFSVSEKSLFKSKNLYNEGKSFSEVVKSKNQIISADEEKWLWEMVPSSSGKTSDLDLMQYNNISPKNQPPGLSEPENQVHQVFDLNRLCNIETQTDIDAFLTECNEDTNFTLCSTTETQTTDDFDCLLYSNMCTQTCEEVDQLFNFNFVHNETQTAWPDLNGCHELHSQ